MFDCMSTLDMFSLIFTGRILCCCISVGLLLPQRGFSNVRVGNAGEEVVLIGAREHAAVVETLERNGNLECHRQFHMHVVEGPKVRTHLRVTGWLSALLHTNI